ncbi:MAG: PAS domain-containing protein [Flavisolibacter sp.]
MKNQPADILFSTSRGTPFSSEEAISILLNNLNETFMFVDKELRLVASNELTKKKMKEYFNVPFSNGMSILELVSAERHDGLRKLYQEVFNGEERTSEAVIINQNRTIYLENHFRPAINDLGQIVGAVVVTRDITETRIAQNVLKEIEERWRFALEGSKQGVWDWNIRTGEAFYSYKKLFGYEDHEMRNRIEEWEEIIHPDDRARMRDTVKKHLTSHDSYLESTYRIKTRDGGYKWILSRGMMVSRDEKGNPLRMIGTHTDITEQIKAEERIRISENQYRSLFDCNPLPCWIYDVNTFQFLEVSQTALDHYGYSREEFLDLTLYDINPPEQWMELRERTSTAKGNKTIAINNWKHRIRNGEIIFVDLRVSTIQYKDVEAKIVVAHDVTAKVEIENELRKSNDRFSYAAKASSEALWEWDVLTGDVYMSEAYTDILGWKVDANRRFDEWHELIHPDDRERTIRDYYNAIEDPATEIWTGEYRYEKLNGSYAIVNDKAIILRNETGKAIKVIGATQDVTSKKKTGEDLRISNDRYRHAILATSDIVWDWDIKNNTIFWSDNYTRVLGWELPEGKNVDIDVCVDHIHPEERERIMKSMNDVIGHAWRTNWHEEFRYRKSDGTYAYVSDRGYVIRNAANEGVRMVGAMQDITERKKSEQLLSLERLIFEMSTNLEISFNDIVYTLLEGIERIHEEAMTAVVLLGKEDSLQIFASKGIPAQFINAINGMKIGRHSGSGGSAMLEKQTVIVDNIDKSDLWKNHKDIAGLQGLKASWSLPIIHSSGNVMGCFDIYFKQVKGPTAYELNSLERIRSILRVLMEHYWSLNEIRVANERFDIMMKATHDLIWDWNLETNEIYRDEIGLKKVYGVSNNDSIKGIYQWLARVHPDDQLKAEETMKEIVKTMVQDTFDIEYRFRRDDGSYSNVYDRGMIIRNPDGKPIRMIGAAQDVTERKRLEQELLQNELERQKAINQATVDTQEQERSDIGKELHDNVNQVLTTTKLYLDLALTNGELKDELIQKCTKNIVSVINEIRQLSRSLMDPSIGDLGLIDTMKDLVESINMTRKLHVNLSVERKIEMLLDKNQKLTIFRIIQEALNNAIKHAKAETVSIVFRSFETSLEVMIEDNGIGFHPSQVKKGAGLKNIQNRIYLINGSHTIQSEPDKGCKITIKFPIQ